MDVDNVLFNVPGGYESSDLPIIFNFFQSMCQNWQWNYYTKVSKHYVFRNSQYVGIITGFSVITSDYSVHEITLAIEMFYHHETYYISQINVKITIFHYAFNSIYVRVFTM